MSPSEPTTRTEVGDVEEVEGDSSFDHRLARALDEFAQQRSRRGFLAKVGRLVLGIVGASVVSVLPVEQISREVAATTCGGVYCGFCGTKCCSSAPCGGGQGVCPPGTTQGGYWTRCCPPGGGGNLYRYRDCCGGSVSCGHCGQCHDGCVQPAWCSGLGAYRCTIVQSLGPLCPS